jgi:hypothetical protein
VLLLPLDYSYLRAACVAQQPLQQTSVTYRWAVLLQSLEAKDPFAQYPVVAKNNPPPRGLKIVYGNPADPSTYPSGTFDIVVDNNGKSMDECQPLIDTYAGEVRTCSHVVNPSPSMQKIFPLYCDALLCSEASAVMVGYDQHA